MRYSNSKKDENSRLCGIIEANNKDRYGNGTDEIVDLKRKITLAKGKTKVDLVIKNARIVNVFSGDVYQTDLAIADGIFVGIGEGYDNARRSYDANGRYMCPGLIDGHIHIESTFLSPIEFCNAVALHGTSSVICDPHEIANVFGLAGLDYFLSSSMNLLVKVYLMMPSCVPATSMERSGATILPTDMQDYLQRYPNRVIGLAEMMNYPGVIIEDAEVLAKLITAGSRPKDGHAPLLSGKLLSAYIIAGLGSDHECTTIKEAREKLRKGMHIMVRQGAHEKNLKDLLPLVNKFNSAHFSLVSDDRDPIDLKENGHMDYLVRMCIMLGLAPIRAIQMASINTARYFGLNHVGAIAPGFKADFILLDDLESFTISQVFLDGTEIGSINAIRKVNNRSIDKNSISVSSVLQENSMHIKNLEDPKMFAIYAGSDTSSSSTSSSLLQVIGVVPGQIITQKRALQAKIGGEYEAIADPNRDLAKLAVIERHHRTGNVGLGFVQGLGIQKGAIASSVAHDSHNLIVAGMNDMDMLTAARHVSSIGGGLSVALDREVITSLPLPIAGLISDMPIESVILSLEALNGACLKLGSNVIKVPFMLLSFLALPVIPSLKLTDKGLVDVDKFQFTDLWINHRYSDKN
ncbi:MAG: adenine deaminase [Nitrososphaeraceae archaeon]|nr:adenine deaminase [Nitrososphaeraceae archaeon]